MTDNFKMIYRILSSLEEQMDKEKVDISKFDHEQLGVSKERWLNYIIMMEDAGYITGVSIKKNIYDEILFDGKNMRITIKGLEYLSENSIMQRMYKIVKGIKDVTPGI